MASSSTTIVAVSSPPGRSARGLIRLAGPDACNVALGLLTENAELPPPRTLAAVRLRAPKIPAILTRFAAPQSYTGDDLVEFQVPGHPALLDRLIHACTERGARLAEPGEFTFRAYTAGRIDLTQAEGIAATIAATSDAQLNAAAHLRHGELGQAAEGLVNALGTALALTEAGIDFVDQEDVVPIAPNELDAALAQVQQQLDDVLSNARPWGAIESLPRVVLVGPPSAGKSTLFNALLGRTRAVISAAPGTTRDAITEPLTLTTPAGQPLEILLIDIAGLDTPQARLDHEAQEAARREIDRADLLLATHDPLKPEAHYLFEDLTQTHTTLHLQTKSDLPKKSEIKHPTSAMLHVSAHAGEGLDDLRAALADRLADRAVSMTAEALALQPRHEAGLKAAQTAIAEARAHLAADPDAHFIPDIELVAGALRDALDELAALGGELTPDDVIGRVFATFCVGK